MSQKLTRSFRDQTRLGASGMAIDCSPLPESDHGLWVIFQNLSEWHHGLRRLEMSRRGEHILHIDRIDTNHWGSG